MNTNDRTLYIEQFKYLTFMYDTSRNIAKKSYWKWQLDEVVTKLSIINCIGKENWK